MISVSGALVHLAAQSHSENSKSSAYKHLGKNFFSLHICNNSIQIYDKTQFIRESLKPEINKFLGYKQLSGLRNTNSITHAVQEYVWQANN